MCSVIAWRSAAIAERRAPIRNVNVLVAVQLPPCVAERSSFAIRSAPDITT